MASRSAKGWSLQRRLLCTALASCLAAWLAGGVVTYLAAQREDSLLFDARLNDLAQTLLVFADHELREVEAAGGTASHTETEGTAHGRYRYQIWSSDGRLLLSSANAPRNQPLMPLNLTGWADQTVQGLAMRVVDRSGPGGRYRIQVAEPLGERLEGADLLSRTMMGGFAGSALILGLLTLLLMRMALRPVNTAAQQITQRGPTDLRAVADADLPVEFAPVVQATNALMSRLEVALRSEREFVAAAAHELRTPLAGLHAQAQLAAHARSTDAQRREALVSLQEGVDHAAHLVGQLLDLARSDALAGDPHRLNAQRSRVDLRSVLERCMSEIGPQAADKGLVVHQILAVPTLMGSDFGLGLIVRNLLANAVAHAPQHGQVGIGTRRVGAFVQLWVEDNGPGVPEADRARLFERFFRAAGNIQPGCGLGLSIVKALADAHGATVSLAQAELGGLRVEVWFADET